MTDPPRVQVPEAGRQKRAPLARNGGVDQVARQHHRREPAPESQALDVAGHGLGAVDLGQYLRRLVDRHDLVAAASSRWVIRPAPHPSSRIRQPWGTAASTISGSPRLGMRRYTSTQLPSGARAAWPLISAGEGYDC